ncbi:hypothetical protein J6590_030303 [Homalodisca vitripennis]|nr:hypothetical protein J6590_030303 [Homalodisca vitripennis]
MVPINYRLSPYTSVVSILPVSRPPAYLTIVQDIVQSSKVLINYRLSPYTSVASVLPVSRPPAYPQSLSPYTSVASVLPVSRPPAYPQSYKISYNRPRFLLITGCHRTRVLRLYYLCRDLQLTHNRTSSKILINYRLSPYTSVASVLPVSRPPAYPQSYKISYNRPRFLLSTDCHRTRVLRLYYLCRDLQLTHNRTRYRTIV